MKTPKLPTFLILFDSYVLLHHVMGEVDGIKGAWAYVEGGMGAVSEAIANCARSFGTDIFTNKVSVTAVLITSITCNYCAHDRLIHEIVRTIFNYSLCFAENSFALLKWSRNAVLCRLLSISRNAVPGNRKKAAQLYSGE